MGTLAPQLKLSRPATSDLLIEDLWHQLRLAVLGLDLPWDRLRVYQDSLPHCGMERSIIRDVAVAGSPNFQLLEELMALGSLVEGTESPLLLVQELKHHRQPGAANPEASAQLILARDRYIAQRINDTLPPGEQGLLFIGMLHRVTPHLAPDVEVIYPLTVTA